MKVSQTAMYTLASDLTWTKLDFDLPEARIAHCSVQIGTNPTTIAMIGGVSQVTDIYQEAKEEQIFICDITNSQCSTGPM